MKPVNRLDYDEEDLVTVLIAEHASLMKRIVIKRNGWESKAMTPSKYYTYELYYVPDLETFRTLIRQIECDGDKCIVNGRPSRTWKEGTTERRNNKTLKHKKTRFLMLDVDDMEIDGWHDTMTPVAAVTAIQDALADVNPGFAKTKLGITLHLTSNWGNPKNTGPRLRLILKLDSVVSTEQLYAFTKELLRRYKHLKIDPAIYRPAQIVYTANPDIIPAVKNPVTPRQRRVQNNRKLGTLNWHQITHGYDAREIALVKQKSHMATQGENKLYTAVSDGLAENGLIREVTDNRLHVTCPWVDEHNSGEGHVTSTSIWQKEGTGNPVFFCQHITCEGRMWRHALDKWKMEGVITHDTIADIVHDEAVEDFVEAPEGVEPDPNQADTTLSYITPILLSKLKNNNINTMGMADIKQTFIMSRSDNKMINRLNGEQISKQVFNSMLPHVDNPFPDASKVGVYKREDLLGMEAWEYVDRTLGIAIGKTASGTTWIPYDKWRDTLLRIGGREFYNSYRGLPIRPIAGECDLFEDHMRYLFPAQLDYDWAMGFFAHMIQKPWEKPTVALLHVSPRKGLGRGLLCELFQNMLGTHARPVDLETIIDNKSAFNYYLNAKLFLYTDETKLNSRRASQANERIKAYITQTRVSINLKGEHEQENTPIFTRAMFMSNTIDALKIDDDDRRLFVTMPPDSSEMPPRSHYKAFGMAIQNQAFMSAVMYRLAHEEIKVFKPFESPPVTAAKDVMQKLTENWMESIARSAIKKYGPSNFGISEGQFKRIIALKVKDNGMLWLLDDIDKEFTLNKHSFKNKIFRKTYMGEVNITLYAKNKIEHSSYARSELGKKAIDTWEEKLQELELNAR